MFKHLHTQVIGLSTISLLNSEEIFKSKSALKSKTDHFLDPFINHKELVIKTG